MKILLNIHYSLVLLHCQPSSFFLLGFFIKFPSRGAHSANVGISVFLRGFLGSRKAGRRPTRGQVRQGGRDACHQSRLAASAHGQTMHFLMVNSQLARCSVSEALAKIELPMYVFRQSE